MCCLILTRRRRAQRNNRSFNEDDVVVGEASPEFENQRLIDDDKPPLLSTIERGIPGDLTKPSANDLYNNIDDPNWRWKRQCNARSYAYINFF